MHNIKIHQKNRSLPLFHVKACSLNKNFDDLQHLLSSNKMAFDIIVVSKTRITKQVSLLNNLNLNNYSFEFTPTETSAGGTFKKRKEELKEEFLLKKEFHTNYKIYRNLLSTLMKRGKRIITISILKQIGIILKVSSATKQ